MRSRFLALAGLLAAAPLVAADDPSDGVSEARLKADVDGIVLDDALTIACGDGALAARLVQRAGRGVMTPAELLRGFAIPAGTRLA